MGRPRKFPSPSVKQRAYRWHRRLAKLPPRVQLHARAALVHGLIVARAASGDVDSQEIESEDYQETALKLLVRYGAEKLREMGDPIPFL